MTRTNRVLIRQRQRRGKRSLSIRRANLASRIERLEDRRLLHGGVDDVTDETSHQHDPADSAAVIGAMSHDMSSDSHDHSHAETVDASPNAIPSLSFVPTVGAGYVDLDIDLNQFELSEANVDGPHVDGQGHLHLYVNGEKVSRVFSDSYRIEDLGPGSYTITLDLYSNDHRAYIVDGERIEASLCVAIAGSGLERILEDPSDGVSIAGLDAGDSSGASVYSAGDFNNDGIDDVIIGASGGDNGVNADDGEVYVVFGSASGLPTSLDLSALNGSDGFKLIGVTSGDLTGTSVAGGGDVNNDGFDDITIGAPGADPNARDAAGSAYVVFGSNSFGATFNLSLLDGTNGIRIDGAAAGDDAGRSVAISGDVNDDGFADVIVGSPQHDSGGTEAGAAYVIFGAANGFGATIDLATLSASDGFRIDGATAGENLGFSVQSAGDVNNDMADDVIVGAPTGIAGSSTSCDAANTVGLIQCDAAAAPGFTLFSPNPSTNTYLIDSNGYVVNTWSASNRPGLSAYLLDDGSLLRTANTGGPNFQAGGNAGAVEIYDWDGNLTWQYNYKSTQVRSHHDVEMLPNGNVLMIAWELKSQAEAIAAGRDPSQITDGRLWPDHIIEVEPTGLNTGDIVWEWHAWDHLVQDFDAGQANFGVVADNPQLIDINFMRNGGEDWLHTNSIDYNPTLDQILLSVHGFSEVWVIDHSTTTAEAASHSGGTSGNGGDLLYRWGNPQAYDRGVAADRELYAQHDARWIEPGLPGADNILIFNNGQGRPGGNASTVEEIAPPVDGGGNYTLNAAQPYGPATTVWTWSATPPTSFYAQNISGAHRLPNGNTFITQGPAGRFIEVDASSTQVYEYINPVTNAGPLAQGATPTGNAVFRATKYDPSFPGFVGKDLSPGGTVETGGGGSTTPTVGVGSAYVLFGADTGLGNIGVGSLSGTNGFKLSGLDVGDQTGYSVSTAGDVNDDGFADVIVGSPRAKVDGISVGAAYVVLGKASGFGANIALASLNGSDGYRLAGDYETDPILSSLFVNATGATGHNGAVVNFDSVIPDANHVHVHTSGIPHYPTLGPWPGNPNDATDQDVTFYLPRDPQVQAGAKTATRLGAIGTWVDGTAIFNWSDGRSYQNADVWNQVAVIFEAASFDACDAHPPGSGQYHTHGAPTCLVTDVSDDGSAHSPILGWSFDGFPIYGPYGYVNGDPLAGIERKESSWATRNITSRTNGPTLAAEPLGSYFEDYEYVGGSGDLDEYNGEFSPTPQYPQGIYHYHVTIDASGDPVFPYTVGPEYNGVVNSGNTNGGGTAPTLDPATISVGTAGDVNNDGFDDVVIGDPDAHVAGVGDAGVAFVVHGTSAAQPADIHLHDLDAATGQRLDGDADGDHAGAAVGPAGDVNNDGGADLIIGASQADPSGATSAGESYVVYGTSSVPTVSIGDAQVTEGHAGTTTLSFDVTLSESSANTVTVDVTTSDDTATSLSVERVASGLAKPIFATAAPGQPDWLFIAEQEGEIKILDLQSGTVNATPFLTVSDVSTNANERGLLGLAFHPDYENNNLLYVYMTDAVGDTLIRQYQANAGGLTADPLSATTILGYAQPFSNHNGGWIGFGGDGYLYIASGDGGSARDPGERGQDITDNLLGKMLRIDVDGDDFTSDANRNYAIPPSNPFVGVTGDDEIWAYGLRNPWRSSFDRKTGDLYIADVGQGVLEEINFQPASSVGGENYGWREREGTIATPGVGGPKPAGAIDPIYEYSHGIGDLQGFSVSGGYVYRGPIRELHGNYFFADYANNRVWSLRFNGDAPAAHDGTNHNDFTDWTDLLTPDVGTIESISSFGEDAAGNLYILDHTGEVFRFSAGADYLSNTSTLTFAPGVTSQSFEVDVLGDRLPEAHETLTALLTSPVNAVIDDGQAVGTIINDDAPRVEYVTVNRGEAQRSIVDEVSVTFDSIVEIDETLGDAFVFSNRGTPDAIQHTPVISNATGQTVVTFNFISGDTVDSRMANLPTLADGNYQLDAISSRIGIGGASLDGNGDGSGGDDFVFGDSEVDAFFRYYGAIDKDRDTDVQDLGQFGLTFRSNSADENFNPWFDINGDNDVDVQDLGQFGQRFRGRMNFA